MDDERTLKIKPKESKPCSKCGEEKAFSEFVRDRGKHDGLSADCKACRYPKNRDYYAKLKEPIIARVTLNNAKKRLLPGEAKKIVEKKNLSPTLPEAGGFNILIEIPARQKRSIIRLLEVHGIEVTAENIKAAAQILVRYGLEQVARPSNPDMEKMLGPLKTPTN